MLRIPAARQKNAKKFSDFLFAAVKPIQHWACVTGQYKLDWTEYKFV
jgi:hypothetical protein